MISCTEFIPLYSEFFRFLDERGGHDAVMRYWIHVSDNSIGDRTNPNSLISFIERADDPFTGAVNYWNHTLTEEACDQYAVIDHKNQLKYSHMRHCPSRGRLNAFEHIEPYYDYCKHCDVIYQRVLEPFGITHEMDMSRIDNAECNALIYKTGHRPNVDITKTEEVPTDDSMTIIDMKADDNKYLHRDFHLIGDLALSYCGENFGDNCVREFLTEFTNRYYAPQIEDIKKRGLVAIKEWLEKLYEIEEASDVLHTELSDDRLTVTIDKSPVIEYMHSLNQEPSRYYIEETRTLYSAVADACNLGFILNYYNEDGGTQFTFFKRSF